LAKPPVSTTVPGSPQGRVRVTTDVQKWMERGRL
jgi:hypothetical protein